MQWFKTNWLLKLNCYVVWLIYFVLSNGDEIFYDECTADTYNSWQGGGLVNTVSSSYCLDSPTTQCFRLQGGPNGGWLEKYIPTTGYYDIFVEITINGLYFDVNDVCVMFFIDSSGSYGQYVFELTNSPGYYKFLLYSPPAPYFNDDPNFRIQLTMQTASTAPLFYFNLVRVSGTLITPSPTGLYT